MANQIVITDKKTHAKSYSPSGNVNLPAPSVVEVQIPKDQVKTITRKGDALVISTNSGEEITLDGFYKEVSGIHSDLVLQENGSLALADVSAANSAQAAGSFSQIESIKPLLISQGTSLGGVAMGLGAMAVGGVGLSAIAKGIAGKSDNTDREAPSAPTLTVTVNPDGSMVVSGTSEPGSSVVITYPGGSVDRVAVDSTGSFSTTEPPKPSGTVTAVAIDPTGNTSPVTSVSYVNPDSTAPTPPTINVVVNPDGSMAISGTAEPGSTVHLTYPNGTTGSVIAGSDGNYSIAAPAMPSGTITANATDLAGNISPNTTASYVNPDSTAPAAPTLNVTVNPDGSMAISGAAEPGSTVHLTLPNGNTANIVVGADGTFSTTAPAMPSGNVTANATDLAGNASPNTTVSYVNSDTTAPTTPTLNVAVNPDGTMAISGAAEPGSTVHLTLPNGNTANIVVGADGTFSTTAPAMPSGNVTANATDAAGNASPNATASYVNPDSTAPAAPTLTVTTNPDNSMTISGTAEPGSTVSLTYPNGTTATLVAGADGSFSTTAPAMPSGNVVAHASDVAGNVSPDTTTPYTNNDSTPPLAPVITINVGAITADGVLPITGTAEPGSTVLLTYPDGTTGSTTAGADGTFSITTPPYQPSGNLVGHAVDVAGNIGPDTTVVYVDSTAPAAPTITSTPNLDGSIVISGTAEPGSTVALTYPDGTNVNVVVDATGNFTSTTPPLQPTGNVVGHATDAAGNVGPDTTIPFTADTTPPTATATAGGITTDTGVSSTDYITSDTTLAVSATLAGALGPGEKVQISLDGGTTWRDAVLVSGTTYTYDNTATPLTDGTYNLQTRVVDGVGNASTLGSQTLTIDSSAPTFGAYTIDLTTLSDNGPNTTDNITGILTPTFTGSITGLSAADATEAAAGRVTATLFNDVNNNNIYDAGDVIYAQGVALTVAGLNATFSAPLSSMFNGTYRMKGLLVDAAGNTSSAGLLDNNANATVVINPSAIPAIAQSTQTNDGLGYSMASGGDFNGDGYADFIISAPHLKTFATGYFVSDAYLMYGSANGLPSLTNIDTLTAAQGIHFTFTAQPPGVNADIGVLGQNLASVGDLNGDGFDDYAMASNRGDRVQVIFGRGGNATSAIDVLSMEAGATTNGFVIKGNPATAWFGSSVNGGDLNNDGYSDLIWGDIGTSGTPGGGAYYVLYGHAGAAGSASWGNLVSSTTGVFAATGVNSDTAGAAIANSTIVKSAAAGSDLGGTAAMVGDVNGDGFNDYIVNAARLNANGGFESGAAYLMFGSATSLGASFNLSALTAGQGVVLHGTEVGEQLGTTSVWGEIAGHQGDSGFTQSQSINNIGDINGDGISDFAVGSPYWGDATSGADLLAPGRVYILYGKAAGSPWANMNLSALNGTNGFYLQSSSSTNAMLGFAISYSGDVNGDGFDDFMVSAPGDDTVATDSGAAYLVFGKAGGGFTTTTDMVTLIASGGAIKYTGTAANDFAGTGTTIADWNGDGVDDFAFGNWESDSGAANAGQYSVYVGSIAKLTQAYTTGNDVLTAGGTSVGAAAIVAGVDFITGGQGNDTIHGIGTDTTGSTSTTIQHDVALGGQGDDTIGIAGTTFTRINGGFGVDTLAFEGTGLVLNLATEGLRVQGFEKFDLGTGGSNTLRLRLADVINESESLTSTQLLTINGDATNTVDLAETIGVGNWQTSSTQVVGGITYDVWHNATLGGNTLADILIKQGINVV